ncbi:DUF4268 domain-containing protein [Candidatus Bathyarchaeota archaeon]|nr:DUF4268 domain-containing protein [Candidatus Bathyarchaeota archaeon]
MSDKMFTKIKRYKLSDKFDDEPSFSKYLANNIEILNEKIPNIDFTDIDPLIEENIGDFRVDISGENVIIENQFNESDHDHLGKIMVYFSNKQVDTAIWICEAARAEHIKAVQWLNERSGDTENFYLLEAKIIQIDDSPYAIDFDIIVSPEQFKELGRTFLRSRDNKWKYILSEIKERFLNKAPDVNISRPGKEYLKIWTIFDKKIHYEWYVWEDEDGKYLIDVALHLEYKEPDRNLKILNDLKKLEKKINTDIGEPIKYADENKTWIQIYVNRELEYDNLDEIINWAVEKMIILYESINPILNNIMK